MYNARRTFWESRPLGVATTCLLRSDNTTARAAEHERRATSEGRAPGARPCPARPPPRKSRTRDSKRRDRLPLNIVIGVASTAPAYSLAATLGFIVAVKGVGVHAPAVMLVAFLPMLLVASAYKYFNRADPDAGTTSPG